MFDYKSLTKEELEEIFTDYLFRLTPMWHQLVCLAFSSDHDRVAFLNGVGTGKTLISLWCAQFWGSKKVLVVCPSSAFSAWERDISKYTDFSFEFLTGSSSNRKSKLKKKKDIFIINYEGLKTVYCNLKKKKGWLINKKSFTHNFDCIILDEIHKCKNYKSLQSKISLELSKLAKNVVGLTGTAVDKSLLDLFNIYKVIDLGKALGASFWDYKMRYFKPGVFEWTIKEGAKEQILKRVSSCTLSFNREECFDLPELQEITKEVEPSKEFTSLQLKVIEGEDLNLNGIVVQTSTDSLDEREINRFRSRRAKLLQELPNGFLYYKDEESNRQTYNLKKNPKIEALIDIVEDTSGKVVIFYNFTEEGSMIQQALTNNKFPFSLICGGQKPEVRLTEVKNFNEDERIKCMVVQQSSGSEGWDGSVANVVIFFSPIASPKLRTQCVGRIHRLGQKNCCLALDLIMKHSIDRRVIKNRGERFDIVQEAMEYIREFGGIEEE